MTIALDAIGNPLSDGTWSYTWQHGRQLATMSNGTTAWSFTYNADGLRTKRSNGSTTYSYVYNGDRLSQMTVGSDTLSFSYDAGGIPMAVQYKGTTYYYATNIQGDVIAILNGSGAAVVEYAYDAWGSHISTSGSMAATLGTANPLRYRSYIYDADTNLYYLQSRYYSSETGRFLNADEFTTTGQGFVGNNMFAYCLNNPVNLADLNGKIGLGAILGKAALGAAVNVLTTYIGAKVTGQSYSWKDAGIAALSGALGTGGTGLKIAAGIVSGVYSGVMAYRNGADPWKAALSGAVSAWGTTVSVANIAGWTQTTLTLGVSTFTDVVFGTASNSIAATTYRASIDTSTSKNNQLQSVQSAKHLNRAKLHAARKLLY